MSKISMLVLNQYDSYSYQLPVRIYRDQHKALLEADWLNQKMAKDIKERIHKSLDQHMAEEVPEYRDYIEIDYGIPMNNEAWDAIDDNQKLNEEIKSDRWTMECIAYGINFARNLAFDADKMQKHIENIMENEYYSVTLIDYIGE